MSILLFYYDFGVIYLPFGARVFVVQTAVCVTKTHLAIAAEMPITPKGVVPTESGCTTFHV